MATTYDKNATSMGERLMCLPTFIPAVYPVALDDLGGKARKWFSNLEGVDNRNRSVVFHTVSSSSRDEDISITPQEVGIVIDRSIDVSDTGEIDEVSYHLDVSDVHDNASSLPPWGRRKCEAGLMEKVMKILSTDMEKIMRHYGEHPDRDLVIILMISASAAEHYPIVLAKQLDEYLMSSDPYDWISSSVHQYMEKYLSEFSWTRELFPEDDNELQCHGAEMGFS